MIGMMDKGSGTSQFPGQQGNPMQGLGGGLAQLFANNQPAVAQGASTQVPQIAAPHTQGALMPSPEQAAAATRARMLANSPQGPAPQARQQFGSWVHDPIKTMPGYRSR